MGGEQYIAPAVKLRLHNRSDESAALRPGHGRVPPEGRGEPHLGLRLRAGGRAQGPLAARPAVGVTLKSDARYHSQGPVEGMFAHEQFRDALVEIFLRVGSSGWVELRPGARRAAGRRAVGGLAGVLPAPAALPRPLPRRLPLAVPSH